MNDFNEILESRKSVKGFDPNYKIPHEEMNEIISKATKAPSSVNMQPWRFVVVESDEAKAKLRPLIRFNTSQNDTFSAMIVIFGDLQCYEEGEFIYNKAVEEGHMPQEVKDQILPFVMDTYNMNQSILASRAKLISVNLKIPLTASLKDFEFLGMVVKIFLRK